MFIRRRVDLHCALLEKLDNLSLVRSCGVVGPHGEMKASLNFTKNYTKQRGIFSQKQILLCFFKYKLPQAKI